MNATSEVESPSADRLCSKCAAIDFSTEDKPDKNYLLRHVGSASALSSAGLCDLCDIMDWMLQAPPNDTQRENLCLIEIKAEMGGDYRHCEWALGFMALARPSGTRQHWGQPYDGISKVPRFATFSNSSDNASRRKDMAYCRSSCIDPGCLDYAAIGSLLKHCNRTHKVCRPSPWPSLPIQLIDCMEQKVVPALESCDYTTLSYVWGKSPDESYVSSDGSLVNPPATIRDAMTVTLALGYRYIWIDRYCIDQNDTTKKLAQIWQMGSVYRASVLTIFSTGGTGPQHGLPGVGKTLRQSQIKRTIHGREIVGVLDQPRKLIEDSVWMSRGWTYQEAMLSKRRLCLTDQQFYFECCSDLSRDEIYGLGNRYMKVTTA